MLKPIDYILDRITMYQLIWYFLIALLVIATGLSAFGILPYSPLAIVFSACLLTLICLATNELFGWLFKAPINFESAYVSALILTLIITPKISLKQILFMSLAGALAMASKYLLAINKKHLFNPAAIAVVITALAGQPASWWVGSHAMLPYVAIGGLLIVRKVRKTTMVAVFLLAAAASTILVNLLGHHDLVDNLQKTALYSPLLFLAFVMLTEPLTSPTTRAKQLWYAAVAGALFTPQLHIGQYFTSPERALMLANLLAFVTGLKKNLTPKFLAKETVAPDITDFVFKPNQRLRYQPGQYMLWTLPHNKMDSRGVRRYFTLASSPTEDNLRLGTRFSPKGSSFKQALQSINQHTEIAAGQLGGDFVMPKDVSQKLVFIAGGIGITPYRSMIKYLLDTDEKRVITLLYSETSADELAYTDIFDQAQKQLGIKVVYTLTGPNPPASWKGITGLITAEKIAREVPDYLERIFYISGSHTLVLAMQNNLRSLGVPRRHIKTDFFPGYA
jgi:ferredoxin-NADP reductase/Na+-transporting NADH:ubiquinone oxidoreductase subunit NqrB